jgi:hypothetical protein
MAAKFCTQCGSEVAEGKRFCGRCGAAITQKPQTVETFSDPVQNPAVSPSWSPTPQEPAINAAVSVPAREAPMTQPLSVPLPVEEEHPVESLELLPEEPQFPYAVPILSVQPEPDERQSLPEREAFAEAPKPTNRRSPRLFVGIGLAVVVIAAGAVGFYEWHKKSSEAPVVDTTAQTQSVPDTPPTPSSPEPVEKPDAGTPAPTAGAPAPEVKPEAPIKTPQPAIGERVRPAEKTTDASRNTAPATTEHVAPAPIVRETPASSKAGVLHYSGPPVHYGEVVTFSGLPGAMLRFSFDHSSWAPRISHQPDGTQTLTLRSLTQQDQTQCEVRWEVAQ